jgi:hypothetical protein
MMKDNSDEQKLFEQGYGGLYCVEGDPCGCELSDLYPCESGPTAECKPGYKIYHPTKKEMWAIWETNEPKTKEDFKQIGIDF